jgi:hypothetical protein
MFKFNEEEKKNVIVNSGEQANVSSSQQCSLAQQWKRPSRIIALMKKSSMKWRIFKIAAFDIFQREIGLTFFIEK